MVATHDTHNELPWAGGKGAAHASQSEGKTVSRTRWSQRGMRVERAGGAGSIGTVDCRCKRVRSEGGEA
jgi:hypothetical protein